MYTLKIRFIGEIPILASDSERIGPGYRSDIYGITGIPDNIIYSDVPKVVGAWVARGGGFSPIYRENWKQILDELEKMGVEVIVDG